MPRSRSAKPILVVVAGAVGERAARLLAETQAVETVDPAAADPAGHAAVAFGADRPYPARQLALDDACRAAGVPWTSAVLLGVEFWVGPAIQPRRPPCFDCWLRRTRSQAADLAVHDAIVDLADGDDRPWFAGRLPAFEEQVAALLAAETLALARKTYRAEPAGVGRFLEGSLLEAGPRTRRFARIGVCPRCSPADPDATWRDLAAAFPPGWRDRA